MTQPSLFHLREELQYTIKLANKVELAGLSVNMKKAKKQRKDGNKEPASPL